MNFMSTAVAQKTAKSFMRFVAVFSQILMVKQDSEFDKKYVTSASGRPFTFQPGDTFEVFFQVLHYADGWFTDQQRRDREFLFELLPEKDRGFSPTWTQPMFYFLKIVARTDHGNVDLNPSDLVHFERVKDGDQIPFKIDDDEWFDLWTREPRNARD